MMRRIFPLGVQVWLFMFLSIALFVSEGASAENPQVLNLDQLIGMALEKSPELGAAEQEVLSAKSDLAQAKAGRWAQAEFVGTFGPVDDAEEPIVVGRLVDRNRFVGRIEDRDEDSVGIFGRLDIAIIQPLYTFGKISHRKNAAELGVAAQKAGKDAKRGEVIQNVKELYYGMIIAQQGKGAADDAEEFYADARRRIQRLLAAGSKNVDESDLYRLESMEAEVKQFRVKAEGGAKLSYLALKKAIGLPPGQEFRLDIKELPKTAQALAPLEEYTRKANTYRPEFKQLEAGIGAQKEMIEAAKADRYPSVFAAAIGSVAGAPGREELDNSYIGDDFNHAYMGVILGSEWKFDFGIGKAKVDKERAAYKKLLFDKEFAERNIPLQVAKYYQDVLEQKAAVEAYGASAIAARKWIVSSFSNFDFGIGTARDMFDAIEKYGKNQGEYLHALFNYHMALANLSYATGEYVSGNP